MTWSRICCCWSVHPITFIFQTRSNIIHRQLEDVTSTLHDPSEIAQTANSLTHLLPLAAFLQRKFGPPSIVSTSLQELAARPHLESFPRLQRQVSLRFHRHKARPARQPPQAFFGGWKTFAITHFTREVKTSPDFTRRSNHSVQFFGC